ncbi:Hsp20/alpha crystallin family protein [Bacillus sp. AGMB 02131]|uniref:Hsp20/alpha crystallin family protein n=1 Tax=Peribacillus faecalis TaxID=2772559 RepID=A0A927HCR8_9BACI|nr:Hsp20/alpha crystallin family protein [Peribacillus faecalis]MBD3109806.1 Hsp20/alpha crystallin family protein [Peribacillus faecalis]
MNPWNILFPFQKYMKNFNGANQMKDMDEYISKFLSGLQNGDFGQMMNNTASANQQESAQNKLAAAIFETHSDVYVRIPIAERALMKHMKIYHTSNLLIVEGIPERTDRNTYTLPAIVRKKGNTALYKDGTLEIKLPKVNDLQYSEINITEQ